MGTRNMTLIQLDGEYKVSKYCQWDGYMDSLGYEIMSTMKALVREPELLESLKTRVRAVEQLTQDQVKDLWVKAGAYPNSDPGTYTNGTGMDVAAFVTFEVSDRFKEANPELSRDTNGADVIRMIISGQKVHNIIGHDFVGDSLFCEYAYVVDLDQHTFEIYKGFNQTPLGPDDRFVDVAGSGDYQPVSLFQKYSFEGLKMIEDVGAEIKRLSEKEWK